MVFGVMLIRTYEGESAYLCKYLQPLIPMRYINMAYMFEILRLGHGLSTCPN